MLEWLERRNYDLHGLGSKLLRAIQSYPWERHLTIFFCLVVLASSSKFQSYPYKKLKKQNKKIQVDSSILASPEAGRGKVLEKIILLHMQFQF